MDFVILWLDQGIQRGRGVIASTVVVPGDVAAVLSIAGEKFFAPACVSVGDGFCFPPTRPLIKSGGHPQLPRQEVSCISCEPAGGARPTVCLSLHVWMSGNGGPSPPYYGYGDRFIYCGRKFFAPACVAAGMTVIDGGRTHMSAPACFAVGDRRARRPRPCIPRVEKMRDSYRYQLQKFRNILDS